MQGVAIILLAHSKLLTRQLHEQHTNQKYQSFSQVRKEKASYAAVNISHELLHRHVALKVSAARKQIFPTELPQILYNLKHHLDI